MFSPPEDRGWWNDNRWVEIDWKEYDSQRRYKKQIKGRLGIVDLVRRYVDLKPNGPRWTALSFPTRETKAGFLYRKKRVFFYCFGLSGLGIFLIFMQKSMGWFSWNACSIGCRNRYPHWIWQRSFRSWQYWAKQIPKSGNAETPWNFIFLFYLLPAKSRSGRMQGIYWKKRSGQRHSKKILNWFRLTRMEWLGEYLRREAVFRLILPVTLVCYTNLLPEKIYDRFRGRLIFPIKIFLARSLLFGGRIIIDCDEAKNISIARTPPFTKRGPPVWTLPGKTRNLPQKVSRFSDRRIHMWCPHAASIRLWKMLSEYWEQPFTIEQIKRLSGVLPHKL